MGRKIGRSYYAEPGDKEHEEGLKTKYSKTLVDFGKNTLDKMFDSWLIVGKDIYPRNFKEVEDGELMSGAILFNPGDKYSSSEKDKRGSVAMMLLDVVESVCDDEEQVETYLEALWKTAKQIHKKEKGEEEPDNLTKKERQKVELLKSFVGTCLDMFETYDGKRKFAKSCVISFVPAYLLENGNSDTQRKVREYMKRSAQNGELEDSPVTKTIDVLASVVDKTLEMVDKGASSDDIDDMMRATVDGLMK